MRLDHAFELRRRKGFFDIIRSPKLQGLDIALHLQAACQDHHGVVPVAGQSERREIARFKCRATLVVASKGVP